MQRAPLPLDDGVRRLYEGSIRISQRTPSPGSGFVRADPNAIREGAEYWHPSPGLIPAHHATVGLDGPPGGWRMVKFTIPPGQGHIRGSGAGAVTHVMAPVKDKNETAMKEIPVSDVYRYNIGEFAKVPARLAEGVAGELPEDVRRNIASFGSGETGDIAVQLSKLRTKAGLPGVATRTAGRRTKRRVTRRRKRSLRKK